MGEKKTKKSPLLENQKTFNTAYLGIALFLIYSFQIFMAKRSTLNLSYNEFLKLLKGKSIAEITITDNKISGRLKEEGHAQSTDRAQYFQTNRVDLGLSKLLEEHQVKYTQVIESTLLRDLFSWIFPTLFFLGLWFFIIKKMASKSMGGGFMSVGKSKAKVYMEKDTCVSFKDVAGVDEAKDELEEVIDFLKNSEKYARLGGRMPKGLLLVGPPGTGKTLLAKAVAGEANVPFFSISGSEFVEMFVGVGAARVRDLFDQARKKSPCIIFIDELDALGKARGNSPLSGGNDEKEQTLNQLLTELDGFDTKEGVVLLAATNRPDSLDPALLRSGRFDRQVLVDVPDKKGRIDILKVHLKNIKASSQLSLEEIAGLTTGFTGADLANLTNEAALVATRFESEYVEPKHFSLAIERIIAGPEKKSRILNFFERKSVAYHEIGHALVAGGLNTVDMVHKVSIIPRGMGALGYTIQRPSEDRFILKKEELENKISVLLAGRVAEKIIFNHLSTGASDDLVKATDIAKDMVTRYGMVAKLGHVVFVEKQQNYLNIGNSQLSNLHSAPTLELIDESVQNILEVAFNKSFHFLTENKDILIAAAENLLKEETLGREDLMVYFKKLKI